MSNTARTAGPLLRIPLLSGLLTLTSTLYAQSTEHHELLAGVGAAGDAFATSVATDGSLVVIGAPFAAATGSAYVFAADSGMQRLQLTASSGAAGDRFGAAVAIDVGLVIVGAPHADLAGQESGAAFVFDAITGTQVRTLVPAAATAGDQFGCAVAARGGIAVVGALGAAYLFDLASGQELITLLPSGGSTTLGLSGFGESVAIDDGIVVVGARLENGISGLAGAAYVFDAGTGDQLHRLVALDGTSWANFGASVAIDAHLIVVGAPESSPVFWHSGSSYLFDAITGQQTRRIVPTDGHLQAKFGSMVAVDGLYVVVGSQGQNASGVFGAGAAYLYAAPGGDFVAKLVASDASAGDELGGAVATSGGIVVCGAPRDDDNAVDAGSAYLFDAGGTVTPMSGCFGNAGSLEHIGGIAVANQVLHLRLDSAQPGTVWALVAVSASPVPGWPNCGVDLGGVGELLIDAPAGALLTQWLGLPVELGLALPPQNGLIGFPFYLQGAFVAPSNPVSFVRLTGALAVVLGGYL